MRRKLQHQLRLDERLFSCTGNKLFRECRVASAGENSLAQRARFATPTRASPRLQNRGENNPYTFNIYVTAGVKHPSIAEGPVYTLHEVSSEPNLRTVKKMIREQIPDVCIKAGIFWLPKKGKQCHTLCTEVDFQTAKEEYNNAGIVKNVRLAVAVLSNSGVGKPTATIRRAIIPHDKKAKKRKTAVSPSTDSDSDASCDEAAYEKFIEQSSDKGKLKSSNSDWNTCHVELRKALEQDGTLDRYGIQHLSLWTDLIQDGKVSGAHEEPDWRKYLNVVHVEPLPKRGMGLVRAKGQNDVLTTFLMQQEMRREEERENEKRRQRQEELLRQERQEDRKLEKQQASSMQALILHALSPRPQFGDGLSTCSSTQLSREIPTLNQGLVKMSVKDIGDALLTLKLGRYVQAFQDQQIDGAVLSHLNDEGLQQLGMNEQLHRSVLLGFISRKLLG
ncbi:hypothetical protein OS493_034931 [Desmophyllum pertusum]|uniref:SAM domain-containing protein n=1 Tax=Desmophyllum pertusum TaxID=174260 RepID=A0A9X0CNW6_9CNID|nr:hypothetical protein OS493_034931 [Desmophyllum pertusum]